MMSDRVKSLLSQESSELHLRLADFVRRRVQAADRRWSQRYDRWRESERLHRAFRPEDQADQIRRDTPLTEGVTKIIVPYSYAILQSTLAFFMQVFTQRKPLIPVEGVGPADQRAAILMEALLDRESDLMEPTATLLLFQWLLDALRYGVGIIKNTWDVREWPDLVRQVQPITDPFTGQSMGMRDSLERRMVTAYEGNTGLNVSPFNFLPDPHRPLAEFQKGEFVAHRMRMSWTQMRQRQAEGMYVGIGFVPRRGQSGGYGYGPADAPNAGSDLSRIAEMDDGAPETLDAYGQPYVDLHEMWAFVDPGALGLDATPGDPGETPTDVGELGSPFLGGDIPTSSYGTTTPATGTPELWVFTLANWSRVLRAEPANLPGHRFPFELIELNYDVHSPANHGMIETYRGLQYILSWLFNSRMLAVGKTLNNEQVYDPSMVEEIDMLDPEPGRLIRLKEQWWGAGKIQEAVFPLPVSDVTASHHNDAHVVTDLIQFVSGVNNNIMGQVNSGRRAATEIQGVMNLSSGRLKMLCEIASQQGMQPWARQRARNIQAFAGQLGLRLKDDYAAALGAPFITVSPEMLQGEFMFPFTEAGMPTDRLFEANTFKEILMMGLQSGVATPLLQNFPWMQILGRLLRALNIKDLQSWGLSLPQLVLQPDEMVQNQVQQGNYVPGGGPPTGGAPNGNGTASPEHAGQAQDGRAAPPQNARPNGNANLSGA